MGIEFVSLKTVVSPRKFSELWKTLGCSCDVVAFCIRTFVADFVNT